MKYKFLIILFLFLLNCFCTSKMFAQRVIDNDDPLELNGEWLNDSNTGFYSSLEFDSSTNLVIVKRFYSGELRFKYKLIGNMFILDDGIKKYENFIFMKKYDDFMFFTTFLDGKWKTLFHKVVRKVL